MPETMSLERRKVLKAFGANLVLTEGAKGMKGSIAKAEEIFASDPKKFVLLAAIQESGQPADSLRDHRTGNLGRHRGPDRRALSAASAPAAPSPVSRATSRERKKIISIGVEPVSSPVITQTLKGEEVKPGPHKIQGIGAGFIPDTLDLSMVDRVELVTNEESVEMAQPLRPRRGSSPAFRAVPRWPPRFGSRVSRK